MVRQKTRRHASKQKGRKTQSKKQRVNLSSFIDTQAKGRVLALEPPINRSLDNLDDTFRSKVVNVLQSLKDIGKPFKLVEGFRTVERQQWLYGSGRPNEPYGREGPIVTYMDGVEKRSNHQGDGTPGSGKAADCYPLKDRKVHIPPVSDPIWQAYADIVTAEDLVAGYNWPRFKDAPHCELSN